ncbi:hypothetical protein GCM10017667_26420 [Streptomyces filamentosus]|uniref:Uncharacterized protein n=1 Tax=Streptomyces filamentosus TaxID=67294 RepID=A0A919BJD4_STRFL|nr:hypothetical protein GCM10017667_26420 [Streptomyces filamentosus]
MVEDGRGAGGLLVAFAGAVKHGPEPAEAFVADPVAGRFAPRAAAPEAAGNRPALGSS